MIAKAFAFPAAEESIRRGVTDSTEVDAVMRISLRLLSPRALAWLSVGAIACVFSTGWPAVRAAESFSPSPSGSLTTPTAEHLGDTLTVIQRPLLNIPSFVLPGGSFDISCDAPAGTRDWSAELIHGARHVPLAVTDAVYESSTLWWRLTVTAPADVPSGLYDLSVAAAGGITDVTKHAVKVVPSYPMEYYFVHITDTHLPTHLFYTDPEAATDSAATVDLRAIIDDVNIINPEFVLITGDLVNEGELEDYHIYRYFSKAQRVLGEFEVPIFLTSGNHDLGGWDATPPSDGTARRNWWRFFGWRRLANPPAGAPARTQDYSFDYGRVHFVGLEAYINYDRWRQPYYGEQSFTPAQLQWLNADLEASAGNLANVLFYHDDFGNQLNLSTLDVEMALWGHIHRDSGSLTSLPYNLSTATTADGKRIYRVVRVSNGVLTPLATVSAGANGEKLRAVFSRENDGTRDSLSAVVTNDLPIRFQNARIRFLMPKEIQDLEVSGGTLLQTDDSGSTLVCTVGIDLAANSAQTVVVKGRVQSPPAGMELRQNLPNPFRARTVIDFDLPSAGPVKLAVFGPDGRRVATLIDEVLPASSRTAEWDGRDDNGRPVSSGIYFYRLVTPDGTRTRRLSLVR